MGCAVSRIDKEERVQVCKQRRRLMKQLMAFRGKFADAQLVYLRALKNTGVTLRQFTESESLDMEISNDVLALPPSPPPPLPPSPPPPPPFSPDSRKVENDQKEEVGREEESKEIAKFDTSVSHPILDSLGESWDPFRSSSPYHWGKEEIVEPVEEEWAETKTEFEEEEPEEKVSTNVVAGPLPEKPQTAGSVDDNSSTTSWYAKDTTPAAMVLRRSKKTLESIAKELDDHFLKASAGVEEITVLMDINGSAVFPLQNFRENKGKKGNTAKVFSALSWSWSSNSLPFTRESVDSSRSSEPCRLGAHCITLKKLLDEETKLYKEVKEEELTKIELEKKSSLLHKQEEENHEWNKMEKTRLSVENLEADLSHLQLSINRTTSSILTHIDDELYPQLVAITSGLLHVWRMMYESHQAQYHISQQLNHLTDDQKMDLSTAHHCQAAAQLESEVYHWYSSFCQVVNFQLEYVRALCGWIKLTESLKDDHRQSLHSSAVHSFCHQWQLALERLPDKAASEAIKGLCSAIHSIVVQQEEECSLQRKYEKAEKRLQKELVSLDEMERKLKHGEDEDANLGPKHPLTLKRTKIEALKKQVADEKVRYLKSVQATKTMILNNLKTSLPSVFKALMDFSRGSIDAIDAIFNQIKPVDNCEAEVESLQN